MVRRLCILCLLVALWPGLALAHSRELIEADKQVNALYAQGRYAEAEPFARRALELAEAAERAPWDFGVHLAKGA